MTSYRSASEEIDCMVGDESMKQRVMQRSTCRLLGKVNGCSLVGSWTGFNTGDRCRPQSIFMECGSSLFQ